jgi:Fur family ferric uptake transcriptional regulator
MILDCKKNTVAFDVRSHLAPGRDVAHLLRALATSPMSRPRKTPRATAPATADLQAEIRAHGMRSTGSRVAVLAYLSEASAPLSHTEIFEALAGRGFDRATIYRNLVDLADVGLLTRSDLGDHVWRFERKRATAGHSEDHPHFVCTDCGDVKCLPDLAVKVVPASGTPRALRTRQVAVQVKGRCDDCN